MHPQKSSTEVTTWLKENDASDLIDAFYEGTYYKLDSLDDRAIDSIAKDKPGLANTLKHSIAQKKKQGEATPMTPPKLPAGTTLDITSPKLTSPDGITFSVAKSLSVESTKAAIVSPNNLSAEEWIVVARGTNLLHAYNISASEPTWADTPALDWKVPDRDDFARSEISHGEVSSALTYSETTSAYVESGFDIETATAGYAFCAASFERSNKHKTAKSAKTKTLTQVGTWKYPRAHICLDKCTVTSTRFIRAIREALKAKDKFGELNKVFEVYGHVVPTSVLLGGLLSYTSSSKSTSSANESSDETTIKSAVEGKLHGASASAGLGIGTSFGKKDENLDTEELTVFKNRGGDSLLCSDPAKWAPTVLDPTHWAVISMKGMRSTVDLLDDKLRQEVLEVWLNSQAILDPIELDWKDGEGRLFSKGGGFAAAMRQCGDGPRGSVQLASFASSEGTQQDAPHSAAGAAYVHRYKSGDNWIECNSVCLPVAQGGAFKTMFEATTGNPDARLVFFPSNLSFGQWRPVIGSSPIITANVEGEYTRDGFLFVSIEASIDGTRGGVKASINGQEIAGSFVHKWYKSDERIERQSFCIPVPRHSKFGIALDPSVGTPLIHASFMPLIDSRWKLQAAVPISANTQMDAATDGILHGWIRQSGNGDRGTLKLYAGEDARSGSPKLPPCAAAAMHHYQKNDRWVLYSSATLPISKGTTYKALHSASAGKPDAHIYWTGLVRA